MVNFIHKAGLRAQYDEVKKAVGIGNNSFAIVKRLLNQSQDDMQDDNAIDVLSDKQYTADEKLEFLMGFRDAATRCEALITALENSTDPKIIHEALTCLESLLKIQEVFKTPAERRGVATDILGLFEMLVNQNVPATLLKFLGDGLPGDIQRLAANCLCHIALGVRIASLPLDSPLHPQHNLFRKSLIHVGVVDPLVALANNANEEEAQEAALVALAAIAFGSYECRDFVLNTIIRENPTHAQDTFAVNLSTANQGSDALAQLRLQELNTLASQAGIGQEEMDQLFKMWGGSADAQISKDMFKQGLESIGITDPLVIEQSFLAFDDDRSGTIDFREFVAGMAILNRGSAEDRLRLMFRSYDLDGSGYLEPDEVYALYRTALLANGYTAQSAELEHENLLRTVEECFKKVDLDGDGKLDFNEFKLAVESNTIMNECFVAVPFQN